MAEFVGPPEPTRNSTSGFSLGGYGGLAMFAGGTALSIFGQMQANRDQAEAELENAAWLEEQAEFIELSAEREEEIFTDEIETFVGQQIGAFASNNVELSGSALDVINDTFTKAEKEVDAIRLQSQFKSREARLKASSSRRTSEALTDPTTNLLQAGGTILTGASRFI